jgi:hypothetical protein
MGPQHQIEGNKRTRGESIKKNRDGEEQLKKIVAENQSGGQEMGGRNKGEGRKEEERFQNDTLVLCSCGMTSQLHSVS